MHPCYNPMSNIRKRKAADIDTTELRKFIEARRAAAGPSFVETSPTPASASDYESRIIPVSHSHADDPISSERLRQAVEEVRSRRVVTAAHTRTGQSSSASSQQATHREPLLVQNNRSPSQDTEYEALAFILILLLIALLISDSKDRTTSTTMC